MQWMLHIDMFDAIINARHNHLHVVIVYMLYYVFFFVNM